MDNRVRTEQAEIESREFHLMAFVCLAIVVLAFGLALLMYPAVFANQASQHGTSRIAFFGFCALACLLVSYIVDRQMMIRRLRHQIATDRLEASEALNRASAELLETLPNFNTFEDRLAMEFRRAVTANLSLSVLVISIKLRSGFSEPEPRFVRSGRRRKVNIQAAARARFCLQSAAGIHWRDLAWSQPCCNEESFDPAGGRIVRRGGSQQSIFFRYPFNQLP